MIYLDTHVVAWLYSGDAALLSQRARASIEGEAPRISPMVLLELDLLREVGRLRVGATAILDHLRARIGIEICDLPFEKIISSARGLDWTRDPFDRVIVGHALTAKGRLVTKDRSIRKRFRDAVW